MMANLHANVSVLVYILAVLFGTFFSIKIYCVYTQLPLMVLELPEDWALGSYTMLITGLGNVVLIPYAVYYKLAKNPIADHLLIYINITVGACCCFLMAFLWNKTTVISGQVHSLPFLVLLAGFSVVDVIASVTHLKFMGTFKPQYMSGYYVGIGAGGLIPSCVGLIQGAAKDPQCRNITRTLLEEKTGIIKERFEVMAIYGSPNISVQEAYLITFGIICMSGIAFALLHKSNFCRQEKIQSSGDQELLESAEEATCESQIINGVSKEHIMETSFSKNHPEMRSCKENVLMVFLVFWVMCWLYGIKAPILSYACLPYGNLTFSLAANLNAFVVPLASFLALFVAVNSLAILGGLAFLGTIFICFLIYIAAMSPSPPLQHEVIGEAIMVSASVIIAATMSYVRCCLSIKAQTSGAGNALLWVGYVTRIGPLVGALVMFIPITILERFTAIKPCEETGNLYTSV